MSRIPVRIRFQNGLTKSIAERDILNELMDNYEFIESNNPDFIVFGPYGNDIPQPGKYVRIGYYCENIIPDLTICEWAFGIPREEEINNPRYKRIQWHGLDPAMLIKPADYNLEKIYNSKKHFCNFLYSNNVPYREAFFKQLSKYKKIDAPGGSMNNMPSIDTLYHGDIWERKRQYLSAYKFTIAFENYVYPGYQTEKLYDAMLADSLPVYCGDPNVNDIFNTASFINITDFIQPGNQLTSWLQTHSQPNFIDIRPGFYKNASQRLRRKIKAVGRSLKMRLQFDSLDFSPVIDRIIELDKDPDKYIAVFKQPWLIANQPPLTGSLKNRWIEIFNTPISDIRKIN